MKRALISGAAGFVGRHFLSRLEADKWDVVGFDLNDYYSRDAVDWFDTGTTRYDLLVHCAANVGGRVNIDGNPLGVARNLAIDESMFRWAVRTKTPVLYFSSSAAYPVQFQTTTEGRPLIESDLPALTPDNTYGWAKLTGEYLAGKARALGAQVSIVRPFSGYGEDQSLDYPFPSFVDRAKRRADPFDVWGDGRQVRDFIHISDIVEACIRIVEARYEQPVNLCTGRATSFLQLAELVCTAVGYEPTVVTHPDKPTGVAYRVGDPTRMLDFWTPQVSLEDGIARAVAA